MFIKKNACILEKYPGGTVKGRVIAGQVGEVRGGVTAIDFDGADVSALLSGTADIIAALAKVAGGVALGGLVLAGITAWLRMEEEEAARRILPLAAGPVFVRRASRSFWGVLQDEALRFRCDGQELDAPAAGVTFVELKTKKRVGLIDALTIGGSSPERRLTVRMDDGSAYDSDAIIDPKALSFVTSAGVQSIRLRKGGFFTGEDPDTVVRGCYADESRTVELRCVLVETLHRHSLRIEEAIGPIGLPALPKRALPPASR
jgi:hypothetical protein